MNYVARAPLALACERTLECNVLSQQTFARPILDLGCGDGLFASILFAEPIDTGIDPGEKELQLARKTERTLTHSLSGIEIPKSGEAYQTVFSNSVWSTSPRSAQCSRKFIAFKPGGCFYFTVPTDTFEVWSVVNQFLCRVGLGNWRRATASFSTASGNIIMPTPLISGADSPPSPASTCRPHFATMPRGSHSVTIFLRCAPSPSFLLHKLTGRWVPLPPLRTILLRPFRRLMTGWLSPLHIPKAALCSLG